MKALIFLFLSTLIFPQMIVFTSIDIFGHTEVGFSFIEEEIFSIGVQTIDANSFLFFVHYKLNEFRFGAILGVIEKDISFGIDGMWRYKLNGSVFTGLKSSILFPDFTYFIGPTLGIEF
jgi:hypothetical protein